MGRIGRAESRGGERFSLVHIVEPTLEGEAGHVASFVEAVCEAAAGAGVPVRVWAGRGASTAGRFAGAEVRPHFARRWRRPQALFLYRTLLHEPGRIFASTAGRADLLLLSWAASGPIPPRKVFLYCHWVRPKPGKAEALRRLAVRQPDVVIMGPTPTAVAPFHEAGFRDVRVVPYPVARGGDANGGGPDVAEFRHLLFAGAARSDKGFSRVVDLVAHLAAVDAAIPVWMQSSADHYGKTDPMAHADLARLEAAAYPHLRIFRETLDRDTYTGLFRGAICLQLYDRDDFADRISGVTLDALCAGAPVIAAAGTWTARTVARYDAGAVVSELSPESVMGAVEAVRGDYPRFAANAREGGRALREEHDPRRLLEELLA